MSAVRKMLRKLSTNERGATAIEYGLIAALIAVAIMGALRNLGGGSGGMWTRLAGHVSNAN